MTTDLITFPITVEKVTELTALVTAALGDVIPIVSDPTGSAITKKIRILDLPFTFADGLAGGQTIYGGTGSAENLTLHSTYHSTKGYIFFDTGAHNYFHELTGKWLMDNSFSGALPDGGWNLKLNTTIGILTPITATWNIYANNILTDTGATNEHTNIGAYIGYAPDAAAVTCAGIFGEDIQVYKGANVPDNTMVGLSIVMYKVPALGAGVNAGLLLYSTTTGTIPGSGITIAGCTRAGNAIQINGDAGWTNGIVYFDTNGTTELFKVNYLGDLLIYGKFGCNTKAAQAAYASGGVLNAYGTGAFGLDSGANMSALHALVVKIRAALVANGIMS